MCTKNSNQTDKSLQLWVKSWLKHNRKKSNMVAGCVKLCWLICCCFNVNIKWMLAWLKVERGGAEMLKTQGNCLLGIGAAFLSFFFSFFSFSSIYFRVTGATSCICNLPDEKCGVKKSLRLSVLCISDWEQSWSERVRRWVFTVFKFPHCKV